MDCPVRAIAGRPPSPQPALCSPSQMTLPRGISFRSPCLRRLTGDTPALRSQQGHHNLHHLLCPSSRTFILLHLPWGSGLPKPLASDRPLLPHKWSKGLVTPLHSGLAHRPILGAGACDPPPPSRPTTSKQSAPTCRAVSRGQAAVPTRGRLCLQACQGSLQLVVVVLQVLWAEPDTSSSHCGHQAQERGTGPALGERFRPQQSGSRLPGRGTDTISGHRTALGATRSGSHFPPFYAWHHLPSLDTQKGLGEKSAVKVRNGENTETFKHLKPQQVGGACS